MLYFYTLLSRFLFVFLTFSHFTPYPVKHHHTCFVLIYLLTCSSSLMILSGFYPWTKTIFASWFHVYLKTLLYFLKFVPSPAEQIYFGSSLHIWERSCEKWRKWQQNELLIIISVLNSVMSIPMTAALSVTFLVLVCISTCWTLWFSADGSNWYGPVLHIII